MRAGDTVARIGGDEFVVLTRVASLNAAEAVRLRIARALDGEGGTSGEPLRPRASVGATTQDPNIDSADQDIYACKQERAR